MICQLNICSLVIYKVEYKFKRGDNVRIEVGREGLMEWREEGEEGRERELKVLWHIAFKVKLCGEWVVGR